VEAKKKELERRKHDTEEKIVRVTDAIARAGHSDSLLEKLRTLEAERVELQLALSELNSSLPPEPNLPSIEAIKKKAEEVFTNFNPADPEFGRLMHVLVPVLMVYPVRLCDGGSIEMRTRVRLNLTALTSEPQNGPLEVLNRELTVDLFDPPQREQYREQVVHLRAAVAPGDDGLDVDLQLPRDLLACQHAGVAQTVEAALELVAAANFANARAGERLTFARSSALFVEEHGDLPFGMMVEPLVDQRYETPVDLRDKEIQLRYDRHRTDNAVVVIYHKGQRMGAARLLDAVANGLARRKEQP
jgi:hypothetical protein